MIEKIVQFMSGIMGKPVAVGDALIAMLVGLGSALVLFALLTRREDRGERSEANECRNKGGES